MEEGAKGGVSIDGKERGEGEGGWEGGGRCTHLRLFSWRVFSRRQPIWLVPCLLHLWLLALLLARFVVVVVAAVVVVVLGKVVWRYR